MDELINTPLKMSSSEIAELTNKEHRNVLADCRKMFMELDLHAADFSVTQKYGNNNSREVYCLDKRLTEILITGYSTKLRAAVIDRLHDLERKSATKQPTMIDYAHALIEAHKTIEQQQPAVEFTKAMSNVEDSVKVGDLAKMIYSPTMKIGQNRLFKWLYKNKYLKNAQTPYQNYIDMGLFEVISGVVERSQTGRIWHVVKVTGKGVVHITKKLQESQEFNPNTKINY